MAAGLICPNTTSSLFPFGVVDSFLDLADLLGDGNLLGADLRALPQGLASPRPILPVQQGDPLSGGFIP